ncbi:hypothetical protein ACFQ9X_12085 [Catenulispora yoronensis]
MTAPPERNPASANGATRSPAATAKITLWGGPASGKTTYLGALTFAVENSAAAGLGEWTMTGDDGPSKRFQSIERNGLVIAKAFTTHTETVTNLSWTMRGEIGGSRMSRKRFALRKAKPEGEYVEFQLRVPDAPGEAFGSEAHDAKETIVDALLHSDGMIYLFDPTAELRDANSFDYVNDVLEELKSRAQDLDLFVGARLPHHVAVCIAKFDDPVVHELAKKAGMLGQDSFGQPTVPHKHAEAFFDLVCEQTSQSATAVRNTLRGAFRAERRLYFVTSSVGFQQLPHKSTGYETSGPSNVNISANGDPVIRTMIRPINVLEPVLELEQLIRRNGAR